MNTAAVIAALMFAAPASAAIVVDQSTLLEPAQSSAASLAGVIASPSRPTIINTLVQTITAGITGRLTRIDLQAYNAGGTGGVSFSVLDGNGTLPGARTVFNQYVPLATLPTSTGALNGSLLSFDLSGAGFDLTAGQIFSFRLDPANPLTQPGRIALIAGAGPADGNPPPAIAYPGGELFVTLGGPFISTGRDGAFRTFVDNAPTSAVPEPATWLTLTVGFGVIGLSLRRRNRRGRRVARLEARG